MSLPEAVMPPPELRFKRRLDFLLFIRLTWRSRGVARTLTERDLRARYKQAVLGIAWAFAAPLGYLVVFTIFFGHAAEIETFGKPYELFSYAALIPWGFFSACIGSATSAVINNMVLLNKVACPRETFVAASVLTALVDSLIAALAFPVLVLLLGESFYFESFLLAPVFLIQVMFGFGFALLVSAMLIYVRDVRHMLPLLAQLLLFATPVVWGMQALEENTSRGVLALYSFVNPMAPVCESYRRTLVFGVAPDWPLLGLAAVSSTLLLFGGYAVFKKLEPGFADVA
jgi:ABC-type polysaccharide/polyol phosphate export permease